MNTAIQNESVQPSTSMKAVEFQANVESNHSIRLPDNLLTRVPPGKNVRVLVLWDEPEMEYEFGTDEEWTQMSMYMMAKSYEKDGDEFDYDDLLKG